MANKRKRTPNNNLSQRRRTTPRLTTHRERFISAAYFFTSLLFTLYSLQKKIYSLQEKISYIILLHSVSLRRIMRRRVDSTTDAIPFVHMIIGIPIIIYRQKKLVASTERTWTHHYLLVDRRVEKETNNQADVVGPWPTYNSTALRELSIHIIRTCSLCGGVPCIISFFIVPLPSVLFV